MIPTTELDFAEPLALVSFFLHVVCVGIVIWKLKLLRVGVRPVLAHENGPGEPNDEGTCDLAAGSKQQPHQFRSPQIFPLERDETVATTRQRYEDRPRIGGEAFINRGHRAGEHFFFFREATADTVGRRCTRIKQQSQSGLQGKKAERYAGEDKLAKIPLEVDKSMVVDAAEAWTLKYSAR
ncbi:hypothetical protein BC938DRAFT_471506 [Jimgerdemannia flammicorona]|uniref:Uncharacterized protein n=1 Tax=Jimgerdemannia flammicorona TaxID=994334 RepID=A0A433QUK0_9FUNG|nr:hypothetical protein BC938DRAFT_471506 [Jimgerdemannia flammicorona]